MVLCKLCVISLQGIYLADNVAYSDGAYHHTYLEEDSPPQRLMLIASALTGEVGVECSALSRALVLVVIFRQKILESKSIQRRAEYARNLEQGTTVYGLVLSTIQSWDPAVEFPIPCPRRSSCGSIVYCIPTDEQVYVRYIVAYTVSRDCPVNPCCPGNDDNDALYAV